LLTRRMPADRCVPEASRRPQPAFRSVAGVRVAVVVAVVLRLPRRRLRAERLLLDPRWRSPHYRQPRVPAAVGPRLAPAPARRDAAEASPDGLCSRRRARAAR
jgi:hypothetical protein